MEVLLLAAALFAALLMIPFGLPGTWVMLAAGLIYQITVPGTIGTLALVGSTVLAVVAEVLEFTLSARYVRQYGGSRRASWGAILGGIIGAVLGVPVPVVGSVLGAFVGSFVGALALELTRGSSGETATRVAWGALLGRVVSAA